MMIRNLMLVCLMFFTFLSSASVKYVAPEALGKANGNTVSDAADFLDANFWIDVQKSLNKESVTVKFIEGDYSRAYTYKPLILKGIGHKKNQLILEGVPNKTIFTLSEQNKEKSVVMELSNVRNILMKNFSFTGNGRIGYVLRITSTKDGSTENVIVENCNWTDMRGIIYGATGAHKSTTKNVTFRNCVFKRVGIDSHSHHMYHAHGAQHIQVLDSHFEDCTGDYVRFRDNCDFITVAGCTFIRNQNFPVYPFISMPLFNNVDPGDETFASNFKFSGNSFTNAKYAIAFHHYGYSSPGFNYLLTAAEGSKIKAADKLEKMEMLNKFFGIDATKISVSDNKYYNVTTKLAMGTFAKYGATSKGFNGWVDISTLSKD